MNIIYSLSFITIIFCYCYCNENNSDSKKDTLSGKRNESELEALPNPEALSFLRPTFIKVPAFFTPPPPSSQIRVPSYRGIDRIDNGPDIMDINRMDSGIDRIDTRYDPGYQQPPYVNRESERRQRPFGFQSRRPRPSISAGRREGMEIQHTPNLHPEYTRVYPSGVPQENSQIMSSFPVGKRSPNTYTYSGEDAATVEGGRLFRYVPKDERFVSNREDQYVPRAERYDPSREDQYVPKTERIDPSRGDQGSTRDYIGVFNEDRHKEGSLQAALKALWTYKKLAYQTLLARSGAIDNDMMRGPKEKVPWSKSWEPTENEGSPNSDFSEEYDHDPQFSVTDYLDQSEAYNNPVSVSRRNGPYLRPLDGRLSLGNVDPARRGPNVYPISPRYSETGHPGIRSSRVPFRREQPGFDMPRQQFEEIPFMRRGSSRTPRMQLVNKVRRVKQKILKPLTDETTLSYDLTPTEDVPTIPTEDVTTVPADIPFSDQKMTSNDNNIKTLNDVLVLNVTLLDEPEIEESSSNDYYYAYYVDDDSNSVNRMDSGTDEDFYYVYEGVEDEHLSRELPEEGSVERSDDYVRFVYVDDEYLDEYEDEYEDDFVYYEDDDVEDLYYYTEDELSEDDFKVEETLIKRQGLFPPFFGGKKRKVKKKKPFRPSKFPHRKRKVFRPSKGSTSFSQLHAPPHRSSNDTTKNIRVRIKSKPNSKTKKIRMKIKGIPPYPDQVMIASSNDHSSDHFRPLKKNSFAVFKIPAIKSEDNVKGITNTKAGLNTGEHENIKSSVTGNTHFEGMKFKPIVFKAVKNENHQNHVDGFGNIKGTKNTEEGGVVYAEDGAKTHPGFGVTKNTEDGGTRYTEHGGKTHPGFGITKIKVHGVTSHTGGYEGTKSTGYAGAGHTGYEGTRLTGYEGTSQSNYGGTKNTGYGGTRHPGYGGNINAGYVGTSQTGYGGTKNTGYHGAKHPGYGGNINTGYVGTSHSGYGGTKNTGHGGVSSTGYGGMTIKDSAAWHALHKMADNFPDLNKAITVMSFIAFSVFVANLGVNALANSSLGLSFGRGDPNVFTTNPDFSVEGMIKDLSSLFDSRDLQNGTTVSTFEEITDFVTAVYSDLHETTRAEMEKVQEKIQNFLERDLSEDNLPVGDISKSFLSRDLGTEERFQDLQGTCYRRLLCLAHNLTVKYRADDQRNKLLPFWTFGIGWLKRGESEMADLLENLRAELAGQNGKNCRKLFSDCNEETRVEKLAEKVENELKDGSSVVANHKIEVTRRSVESIGKITSETLTEKSTGAKSDNLKIQLIANE